MRLELDQNPSPTLFAEPTTTSDAERKAAEATEYLRDGIKAAQAGNRPGARIALMRAAELDPRSESAWLWLSSISEYPEELYVFLTNVLEINPNNSRAVEWLSATKSLLAKNFVQRGVDAAEVNDSELAVQHFNQALEYDEKNSMAWLWLASLADSDEGRIAYLEKVLEFDPENQDASQQLSAARDGIRTRLLNEARSAAVAGNSSEANELLNAILEVEPNAEDAWILKSHLATAFEDKLVAFKKILEINPENFSAKSNLESLESIMQAVEISAPQPSFVAESESEMLADDADEFVEPETSLDATNLESPFSDVEAVEVSEPDAFDDAFDRFVAEGRENDNADDFETAAATDEPEEITFELSPEQPNLVSDEELTENADDESAVDENANADTPSAVTFVNGSAFANGSAQNPATSVNLATPFDLAMLEQVSAQIPMPNVSLEDESESLPDMPTGFETRLVVAADRDSESKKSACPFCSHENDVQTISCNDCMSVLTLADIELLLANNHADTAVVREAVDRLESEKASRDLTEDELVSLGIGHLNIRNFQYGYNHLLEASQRNPNDVVLAGQVNALHIRLDEIRTQEEANQHLPKGKTILVVDDSPTVRKLIAGKLEKAGHEVVCSVDGIDALTKLEEMKPDLVLLDITMPRMDGYQVCKVIRSNEETKNVPVLMISGKDGFFDKVRGRMAGTTGYITKPFGPETLMKAVEAYLRGEVEAEV